MAVGVLMISQVCVGVYASLGVIEADDGSGLQLSDSHEEAEASLYDSDALGDGVGAGVTDAEPSLRLAEADTPDSEGTVPSSEAVGETVTSVGRIEPSDAEIGSLAESVTEGETAVPSPPEMLGSSVRVADGVGVTLDDPSEVKVTSPLEEATGLSSTREGSALTDSVAEGAGSIDVVGAVVGSMSVVGGSSLIEGELEGGSEEGDGDSLDVEKVLGTGSGSGEGEGDGSGESVGNADVGETSVDGRGPTDDSAGAGETSEEGTGSGEGTAADVSAPPIDNSAEMSGAVVDKVDVTAGVSSVEAAAFSKDEGAVVASLAGGVGSGDGLAEGSASVTGLGELSAGVVGDTSEETGGTTSEEADAGVSVVVGAGVGVGSTRVLVVGTSDAGGDGAS